MCNACENYQRTLCAGHENARGIALLGSAADETACSAAAQGSDGTASIQTTESLAMVLRTTEELQR